jgi:membrane-associated phospholipid phosphatase
MSATKKRTAKARGVKARTASAELAARQVLAGNPGPTARRWLGPLSLVAFVLFAITTYLVINGATGTGFDLPLAAWAQTFPWGPLTYWMNLTNITGGLIQDIAGVLIVIALLIYDRRAGYLMALGAVASLIDQVVKVSIERHRPTADLVKILNPTTGYSYPSGHAVFFTWMYFMLAASLAPKVPPRWRILLWGSAGVLIFLACVARVWAGAHWPSDVIGGFLLGLGWSAFVLWLPERWLPSPSWQWVPLRRARA